MLPGAFVSLAELPLTPNGKLDRAALPPPEGRPDLGVEYAVPTDEMERSVAAIWQEVLGVERVGRHDNFFDLGGHSLLLLQIHDRLRERFGLGAEAAGGEGGAGSLPIVDLFKYPSVAALAGHLTTALSGAAAKPPDPMPPPAAKAKERAAQGRTAVRQERFLKARRKLHE
jgi:catechol 2,3-dioxygenase-like lactoylglutathione lyase family enzyme